jgi:AraC-like DNA-binding protein
MLISLYQNIIVAGEGEDGHNIYFEAGKRVGLTSLEVDRPKFKKFHAYTDDSLTVKLLYVLNDASSNREFYYQGNYSLNTADLIQGQQDSKYEGFLRFLFLQGACNILLAHQIEQFIDDERSDGLLLRQRDLENVKTAIEIIRGDMQTSFSVNDLATRTGTNMNKLQEGFKYLYDTTVNRYIHELRMDEATSLLEHSDLNISEIVMAIGLNSKSYFSKVFMKAYGVSPSYFRANRGKERD